MSTGAKYPRPKLLTAADLDRARISARESLISTRDLWVEIERLYREQTTR